MYCIYVHNSGRQPARMSKLIVRYDARELARMCELFFPEERRHEFTSEPWDGQSFRHFRDPKVICFEHYRAANEAPEVRAIPRSDPKPAA